MKLRVVSAFCADTTLSFTETTKKFFRCFLSGMSVNFTARLENSTTIPQRLSFRNYMDRSVSIVELDNNNRADMDALCKTANTWEEKGGKYAMLIYRSAEFGSKSSDVIKDHYYALTTQTADFHKLNPDSILGLMMFSETYSPENEIMYLEVNPKTIKSLNFFRKYKQVGRRPVDFVHSKFDQKDIFIMSDYNAVKFYKKIGCEQPSRSADYFCHLYLRAPK